MDFESIGIQSLITKLTSMGAEYLPRLLLAFVVLIIGFSVIGKIDRIIQYVVKSKNLDPSLGSFFGGLSSWLLKGMLFISVASMVGIATTSFIAVLGAAGLAVGLALQGSLANFAGGVLILIFKPFKTGDYIMAQGEEGFVDKVDVFATVLTTLDNKRVIIPNSPLAGGKMINVTAEDTRRVDLSVGISYSDNIKTALTALETMCSDHEKVISEPGVFVGVTDYGDSSINLTIRSWCKCEDYWDVFFDLNHSIKATLDQANISIPFPQRDVHMISSN